MKQSKAITPDITWVGKIDHELQTFHGEELSTHRGSSYNAYLVRGERTALIDTVWMPYAKEFVQNLQSEIDLKEIDYIIALHAEIDHSGALPALLNEVPGTPVYCSVNGEKSLRGHYHADWNLIPVKTGDTLDLGGGKRFTFIEARMLHWPDNMMCYLHDEQILFSSDAFGQHLATEMLYNDLIEKADLYREALKYYANILAPFSKLVAAKLKEVAALGLPLRMICPSHGVVWRDQPEQVLRLYEQWSSPGYAKNKITVLYDTMWNSTRRMAESIAAGIRQTDADVEICVRSAGKHDKNDIVTDVFESKALIVGSPTVGRSILSSLAGVLDLIAAMGISGKKAAVFGSYGWSGEGPQVLRGLLEKAGFEMAGDQIREMWVPDEDALDRCMAFGKEFAEAIQ